MTDAIIRRRFEIEIAGQPVAKGRGRIGTMPIKGTSKVRGMIYTPKKTASYENRIKAAAQEAMIGQNPITGAVFVSVTAYVGIPESWSNKKKAQALAGELLPVTKPDIDNYVKSAFDGINTIIIADDNQVTNCGARKLYSEKPRLFIEVTEL